MHPLAVPRHAGVRQQWVSAMLFKPFVDIIEKVLLAPEHSGQSLPHHIGCVLFDAWRRYRVVKLIRLAPPRFNGLTKEVTERVLHTRRGFTQSKSNVRRRARGNTQLVMGGSFCPG